MKTKAFLSKVKLISMCVTAIVISVCLFGALSVTANAADPPHADHKLCGEETCTHAGTEHSSETVYTGLTQAAYSALTKTTLDTADNPENESGDFYKLPAGSYYLEENISDTAVNVLIESDVNLCLNGKSLEVRYVYVKNGTLSICDCSAEKSGVFTSLSTISIFGIEIGMSTPLQGVSPTVNIYGGTLTNRMAIRNRSGLLNIYGGKIGTPTSNSSNNVHSYDYATTNIYGGEFTSTSVNIGVSALSNDRTSKINIYGGSFDAGTRNINATISSSSTVTGAQMNINIYGGDFKVKSSGFSVYAQSAASATNKIKVNVHGGKFRLSSVESIKYFFFTLYGWVDLNITKIDTYGVTSAIYYDPLVNITIDPARDEDVIMTSTGGTVIYNRSVSTPDIKNEEGEAVTPADYGKLIIKGGTFTSTANRVINIATAYTSAEIHGGIFTATSDSASFALYVGANTELLLKGGEIDITGGNSPSSVYVAGVLKIEGAPVLNKKIRIDSATDAEGKYLLDISGYTGESALTVHWCGTVDNTLHGKAVLKGSADKITAYNEGWELINGVDAANVAVAKFNHITHGGNPDVTCTTAGTCSLCPAQYILPHTFGTWQEELPPTCSATGELAHKTCSACTFRYDASDIKIEDISIPINADAHAWNEGAVTTQPTCSAEGVKSFTCTLNTAHTKTEGVAIDTNAHSWNEGTVTTQPTCSAEGVKSFTCTLNGAHTKTEKIASAPDAHAFGLWTQTTPPSCTEKGAAIRVCLNNPAHTEARDSDAYGHSFTIPERDGAEHWNKCRSCGETDTKLAHTLEDGKCSCGYLLPKSGLSGGAIAGITVGSVAVVGLGGFSIFWFVIKKKSLADLLGVFKK